MMMTSAGDTRILRNEVKVAEDQHGDSAKENSMDEKQVHVCICLHAVSIKERIFLNIAKEKRNKINMRELTVYIDHGKKMGIGNVCAVLSVAKVSTWSRELFALSVPFRI